jgi:hypothetical protein
MWLASTPPSPRQVSDLPGPSAASPSEAQPTALPRQIKLYHADPRFAFRVSERVEGDKLAVCFIGENVGTLDCSPSSLLVPTVP